MTKILGQTVQKIAKGISQAILSIFQPAGQRFAQLLDADWSNDSLFTHKTSDLVRLCCSLSYQFFPNPMSGLDILLGSSLNRQESHVGATHGRSIDPIILVALHVRLNKLSSN
ncbi:hypothetical protein [Marinobacter sp. HL-58]|uniref:hypothetical protein n=1 Tax=Marinobacter sp. HL-58 TaxID=1479237 RepID=UPI000487F937|nr:hypothetical protein [Marinobacter sp. HL-58]